MHRNAIAYSIVCAWLGLQPLAQAQIQMPQNAPRSAETKPASLKGVDVVERLGAAIPQDLSFTNDKGEKVTLASYFSGSRPVILNLAYYECPMLCTLVLNGVSEVIKKLDWQAGQSYQLLTLSIDPRETAAQAAAKKRAYLDDLGGKVAPEAWDFLVGDEASIKALADAVGFSYYYDESIQQYAHAAVTMVLTPIGTVSRYLYGITHSVKNLRLALVEASAGKMGTTIDRLMLYCYSYDANARGYVLVAQNVMRLGGALAALSLGIFLGFWWYREKSGVDHA